MKSDQVLISPYIIAIILREFSISYKVTYTAFALDPSILGKECGRDFRNKKLINNKKLSKELTEKTIFNLFAAKYWSNFSEVHLQFAILYKQGKD